MGSEQLIGFSGDRFFKEELQRLIDLHGVKTVVETGTYKGDTTAQLAGMVEQVITIEIHEPYFREARERLDKYPNVKLYFGNAPEILDRFIIPGIFDFRIYMMPVIFFLDSHWYANPLRGELEVIAKNKIKPIIIIHDLKNPDDDTMGFDVYPEQGIVYDWDYVKEQVEAIYGPDGYEKHYNKQAEGSRRGILYITPL